MANVIITLRIMPSDTDVDLGALEGVVKGKIQAFTGETEMRVAQKPIAFGLSALEIIFVTDEKKGSTEALEQDIAALDEVNSCEVIDVRRAVG
ncbi:elongation factor 1-beta [Candidatus Woesearchaeota archaeon]|nr:elongation factor 1-beta [Candidatus Woesearchaeota archaeon]